ncbi:hypothetical protein PN499_03665 [Kamptonema animale CS-326]|uniref:hypothetical protein n=1 Tax=Kamptonema animale TaxID=92934 RepID=UPI00232B2E99|nr:hypothetical protein [Kamptonema animale]MDB9510301.1 hypothetical protein [Kamptonema animale CS-326]
MPKGLVSENLIHININKEGIESNFLGSIPRYLDKFTGVNSCSLSEVKILGAIAHGYSTSVHQGASRFCRVRQMQRLNESLGFDCSRAPY